jgi:hypothetical protein
MANKEVTARIKINKLLEKAGLRCHMKAVYLRRTAPVQRVEFITLAKAHHPCGIGKRLW